MHNGRYHVKATDVTNGRVVEAWVSEGRFSLSPVENASELPGLYMAPGLVDGHVHLSLDFANTGLPNASAELVLHNAQKHLRTGVTVVRDAGYVQQLGLTDVEMPPMPTILRSGWILTPEGRYFPGLDIAKATAPNELRSRLEEVAAHGFKWFKIIADFPGPDMDLFAAPLTYDLEVLRDVVDAAHCSGLRIMAHSTGREVGALVETGVDSIEHGMSVTTDVVRRMAAHGTQWCPTIGTADHFLRHAESLGAPAEPRTAYSARTSDALELAIALGVPVLAGTDELAHGSMHTELEALVRHGLSVDQALGAAITVGREAVGLTGIEEGATADLVLWERDPRADLTEISRPVAVLGNGIWADLEAPLVAPGVTQSIRERLGDRTLEHLHGGEQCVFATANGIV